jgi:hypothetical protein
VTQHIADERPELYAHVAPEPIEAPEPQPVRQIDSVFDKAARLGWTQYQVEEQGLGSFHDFKAALALAYDYLLIHDRRGRR